MTFGESGIIEFKEEWLSSPAPSVPVTDSGSPETVEEWLSSAGPAETFESGKEYAPADLLLHMDGGEGSTVFVDSSPGFISGGGKTVTTNGDAVQKTAAGVFGASGGRFDNAGDYLTLADDPAWDIHAGDFFIEARVNHSSFGGGTYCAHIQDTNNQWNFFQRTSLAGAIGFYVVAGGSTFAVIMTTTVMSTGVTYVVAVERYLGVLYLFIDGVIQTSAAFTRADVFTGTFYIGGGHTSVDDLGGDIDELVLRRSAYARGQNYTPLAVAYTD